MRLVYIDEAGISDAAQEPFCTVAGVSVHGDEKLGLVKAHLRKVVEVNIPVEHRAGFVFQAKELFHGGGKVFKRDSPNWPLEKRLELADELAAIPKLCDLPIAIGFVERAKCPPLLPRDKPLSKHDAAMEANVTAFAKCAMLVERWMRNATTDENCMLIVENNNSMKRFIKEVQGWLQSDEMSALMSAEEKAAYPFPFTRIQEDPLFMEKRSGSVMELADFCAYIGKRCLMNPQDQRYRRFLDPMSVQVVSASPAPQLPSPS